MNNTKPSVTPRLIIALLAIIVIAPLLPLLITGRWDWWEAWVYALIYILGFIISRALAARHHPDLLAERARMTGHADTKEWDKTLSPLVGLVPMLIPLLAGLDARLGWSQITLDLPAKLVMLAVMLGGYALASYALIENRFFPAWCASRQTAITMWFPAGRTAGCGIRAMPGRCSPTSLSVLVGCAVGAAAGGRDCRAAGDPHPAGRPDVTGRTAGLPRVRRKGALPAAAGRVVRPVTAADGVR
jgi:hypothetical protein